jgi:hypothetical protein
MGCTISTAGIAGPLGGFFLIPLMRSSIHPGPGVSPLALFWRVSHLEGASAPERQPFVKMSATFSWVFTCTGHMSACSAVAASSSILDMTPRCLAPLVPGALDCEMYMIAVVLSTISGTQCVGMPASVSISEYDRE